MTHDFTVIDVNCLTYYELPENVNDVSRRKCRRIIKCLRFM
jgi:hypothetical protein